jgi:hypothetical protein
MQEPTWFILVDQPDAPRWSRAMPDDAEEVCAVLCAKLGTVDYLMLDKRTGRAIYAILAFGGFLGLGESYHPLPWSVLKYDTSKGGYVVNLDKQMLKDAPWHHERTGFDWTPEYGRTIDKYYGIASYWD